VKNAIENLVKKVLYNYKKRHKYISEKLKPVFQQKGAIFFVPFVL